MNLRSRALRTLRPWLPEGGWLRAAAKAAAARTARLRHDLYRLAPGLVRPAPRQLTIAVTSACNLRCRGCRYGRDFMLGEKLELDVVRAVIDDAFAAGVATVRFYGGEPLLHRDLPEMVRHASRLGMDAYVTTNALLLGERIDELLAAGLRWATIGFYGLDEEYDDYTQRPGYFAKLRRALQTVRERAGERVQLQLNFLLSRRSCSAAHVRETWEFAREFDLHLCVYPISRTIPFFHQPGPDLDITENERGALGEVVAELLRIKGEHPHRVPASRTFLRALPDLLLGDAAHEVPCDAYELLWIGADGTLQLCDTHFVLGNVKQTRLAQLLFTAAHCRAARDGFQLRCPTCFCKIDSRIRRDSAMVRRHGS